MRKWGIVFLAVALLLGDAATGWAVDFKVKGSWQFAFDYINGGNFMGKNRQGSHQIGQQWAAIHQKRDEFEAIQRLHLQLQAVASESLAGVVFFEIGEQRWGMSAQGGALGADGSNMVKVKQAYVDWMPPHADLKVRMGLQGVRLPGFALDNPVFNDDVAGITASYAFNKSFGLTALWMRPYNDNWLDTADNGVTADYLDNFDLFALLAPVSLDGMKITPWAMAGGMGPNTLKPFTVRNAAGNSKTFTFNNPSSQAIDGLQMRDGLFPAAFSSGRGGASLWNTAYSTMFWGGLTGEVTAFSPFRVSWDFIYGSVDNGREYLNRQGWFGMLLGEYDTDWGVPGLYGWYFSGDDDNPHNGSERLPYVAPPNNLTNSLSSFGYRGNPIMGGGKGVLGTNPNGTWGVGARIKKLSFMDDLSHTLRVNYFGGTNDPKMAAYITGRRPMDGAGRAVYRNNTDFNSFGTYLTRSDSGLEINFDSTYKAAENLSFILETGYIHLWLDEGTWGRYENIAGDSLNYKDAWKVSLNVIYAF